MLLDQIETGAAKKPKIFPIELVVRKSTATVRGFARLEKRHKD
jgi:hypothetical protein